MTVPTARKNAPKVAEAGSTKARHLLGKRARTCVAPVEDSSPSPSAHTSAEWTIVLGKD